MCQNLCSGKEAIATHMINVMMGIDYAFNMCAMKCNCAHHVGGHFGEGHSIYNNSLFPFDDEVSVGDSNFTLTVDNGKNPIGNFLNTLLRPFLHASLTFSWLYFWVV